jgi:hypothetical protein
MVEKTELLKSLRVKMMFRSDIDPHLRYVSETYGTHYLKSFRISNDKN